MFTIAGYIHTTVWEYHTIGYISWKLAQAAYVRHACLRAPCVAWPLFSPSFIELINSKKSDKKSVACFFILSLTSSNTPNK